MISPLSTLIVVIFAATQVVEIIHHGSIFGPKGYLPLRPCAERWAKGKNLPLRCLGQLISCPFCLSPWVCTTLAFSWYFGGVYVKLVIAGFAIARGANILNDITHGITRSPETTEESTDTNVTTDEDYRELSETL